MKTNPVNLDEVTRNNGIAFFRYGHRGWTAVIKRSGNKFMWAFGFKSMTKAARAVHRMDHRLHFYKE